MTSDDLRAALTDEVLEEVYRQAHLGRTGAYPALRDVIIAALQPLWEMPAPQLVFSVNPPYREIAGLPAYDVLGPCYARQVRSCREEWPDDSDAWCGLCERWVKEASVPQNKEDKGE